MGFIAVSVTILGLLFTIIDRHTITENRITALEQNFKVHDNKFKKIAEDDQELYRFLYKVEGRLSSIEGRLSSCKKGRSRL